MLPCSGELRLIYLFLYVFWCKDDTHVLPDELEFSIAQELLNPWTPTGDPEIKIDGKNAYACKLADEKLIAPLGI